MECKGYLMGLFVQTDSSIEPQSSVIKMFFFPLRQKEHFSHGKFYDLLFSRIWKVREPFLYLLFLKCLQLKIINMPKWCILGWHVLNPFMSPI